MSTKLESQRRGVVMRKIDDCLNRIETGDALKFLDELPSDSVNLIVCDGPYGVTTHDWDSVGNVQEYNLELLRKFSRVLTEGGAAYLFGKQDCIDFIDYRKYLTLQSKIIWYQPSRLAQGRKSYTNNYDVICYFSKGKPATFNLEHIRVPQLVELEHRKRCENVPSVKNGKYGKTVFNENGKNPGDVWGDIKQLTYKSKELISREMLHTIQKPEKLMERIVKASSNIGDVVLDPFVGSGTVPVVCEKLKRDFIGCESNPKYVKIANERIERVRKRHMFEAETSLFAVSNEVKEGTKEKLFQASLL